MINKIDKKYKEYFDQIFCLEVSEYLYDPMIAFKNIAHLLKKGGLLYLSTHFIYPVHSPIEDDCLRYTRQGITKILDKCGFEIVELKERDTTGINMIHFYLGQGMRPGKTYKHHQEIGHLVVARKI